MALFPDENPNPVFRASLDGRLLYANQPARDILSALAWQPDTPLGPPFSQAIHALSSPAAARETELDLASGQAFTFRLVPIPGTDYVNVYGHDITRLKQVESRYLESQERLNLIASATVDGVVLLKDGIVADCNSQFAALIGRPMPEVMAMRADEFVAAQDNSRFRDDFCSEQEQHGEITLRHADGTTFPSEVRSRPVRKNGDGNQHLLLFRDLSTLRRREQALDKLNRTLRAIQHSGQALLRAADEAAYLAQVCLNVVDDCGHDLVWVGYLDDSQHICPSAWYGSAEHAPREPGFTLVDGEHIRYLSETCIDTGAPSYCPDSHAEPRLALGNKQDGLRRFRSVLAFPLLAGGRPFGLLAVYSRQPDAFSEREITLLQELADDLAFGIQILRLRQAHDQIEVALRQSQSDMNRAQSVGHIGSWRLDVGQNRLSFSLENHRIFEVPEEALLTYETFLTAVHPEDRELFDHAWQSAEPGKQFELEHRLLVHGRLKWVRERAELEFDATGNLAGGFGTTQDITKRKLMEQALQRSETRYRQLVEQTSDGIFLHDVDGRIVDVNSAGALMHGYSRQEMLGMPASELVTPEDRERLRTAMTGLQEGQVHRDEWRMWRKDGSSFIAEIAARKLYDGRIQAIGRDITERRRNEAERLIAMERQRDALVREVHHRIKNHLQGVIALMRNRIVAQPELAGPLNEAIGQIDTIAQVYGLQCREGESRITLDALIEIAVASAGGSARIGYRQNRAERVCELELREIVPVALVINELITNAVKHSGIASDGPEVMIELSSAADSASLHICNRPAHLPEEFSFTTGRGLGTGLELVRGLLPRRGASLTFRQEADAVVTDLKLTIPVLHPA